MIETTLMLDKKSVDRLRAAMKELDPSSMNAMKKDLKTAIKPLAAQVKASVPTASPFKGMARNYYGLVQWEQPKVTVSVTPARGGKSGWSQIVGLVATGGSSRLGFDYAEMAGVRKRAPRPRSKSYQRRGDSVVRTHANRGQGDALITKARSVSQYNFKAGHFAYGKFLSLRPQMIIISQLIINKVAKEFNTKVQRL